MHTVDASTGEIASKETKIFTEEVHQNKKAKQLAKKIEKTARNAAQSQIETTISKDSGIWVGEESKKLVIPPSEENLMHPVCTSSTSDKSSISEPPSAVSTVISLNANTEPSRSVSPVDRVFDSPASPKSIAKDEKDVKARYSKYWATMKDLAAVATPDNISFLACVVESLKVSSSSPSDTMLSCDDQKSVYQIPDRYTTPSKDKGIDFYLFEGVKSAIERKSYVTNKVTLQQEKSWQLLVRYCLMEVYGSHLGEYCAKGTKGGLRPAIHHDLYRGLLYWTRKWYTDYIDEADFINFINKTAYNKRKATKQKDSEKVLGSSSKRSNNKDKKTASCEENKKQKQKKEQENSGQLMNKELPEQLEKHQSNKTIEQHSESVPKQQRSEQCVGQYSKGICGRQHGAQKFSECQLEHTAEQYHSEQSVEKDSGTSAKEHLVQPKATLHEPSMAAAFPIGTNSGLSSFSTTNYSPFPLHYQNPWNGSNPPNPPNYHAFDLYQRYENPSHLQYAPPNMYYPLCNNPTVQNDQRFENSQTPPISGNYDNTSDCKIFKR